MYRVVFKKFFDAVFASLLLLLISPLFLGLLLIILCYNYGNPFFFQERPGLYGKSFYVIKFKSMLDKFDEQGNQLPDIQRITKLGYFIRRTSLDELPQLINVIKGDMSFIGPRPLLLRYLPYYTENEKKRHNVRPGITGLAQVSGRNYLNWKERLNYDVFYVENLSLILDIKIILKTVSKVLKGSDIKVIPNGTPFDVYRKEEILLSSSGREIEH